MADNVTLNPGTGGAIAAADDIGGVHYQRVKLVHGADGTNAGDVSTANRFPVATVPVLGTLAGGLSTSITTGGTAQNALASNSSRQGWSLQNLSNDDLWVSSLATAVLTAPSMKVPAGSLYETPPGGAGTGAVSVIGATAGQSFAVREW